MPSARLIATTAGLLALGPAGLVAQDTTTTRLATVSYVTGTSVYVSAGRADGLVEGQQLSLIRHDSVAAVLKVMFLSSRQASTEIVSGATDIVVGEQVRFRPQALPTPAPGTTPTAARRPTRHRMSGPGLHGRVGARYLVAKEDPTGTGFDQPSMDLRLDGQALGGTPIGLVADLRTRRTTTTLGDGSSTVDGRTRVYQAALLWNAPGAGIRMEVGRQYLTAVTSVSLFDGGLLEVNHSHLTLGGFAGVEPSPADLGFSRETQDYGGYIQLHALPSSATPWSFTTGAVGSYSRSVTNREFAFAQASLNARVLSIYALQEVDYYRPWKVAQGESPISPTSTYVSGSIRPARWISFNGAYDNRRSVRLYRDAVDPATQFDDAYRRGVWGGVTLLGHRVRLGGDVRRSDGGTGGTATGYTGTLGFDRLTPLHLSLTGRATWYHNPDLEGRIYTGRLGGDPFGPVHLEVNGGLREEDNPLAVPAHRRFTWYGGDLDVSLARGWYVALSATREIGPDARNTQLYSSLSWRF